jgi:transcriptional regulator with XRE-family HTH domain
MGTARRKLARLPQKLRRIRLSLQLSQNELITQLGLSEELTQARISAYERGVREPPLLILLKYARLAGVYVDQLIDDDLDLPSKLSHGRSIGASKKRDAGKLKSKRR